MKRNKKIIATMLLSSVILVVSSCSSKIPANTVFSESDLPGKTIGVQIGTTGDICASDYKEEGSTVERYNKGADAIQALKQGKIDCVIIDNEPAKVFVEKNNTLKILDEPLQEEEYAICLKKGNTDLKEKLNTVLKDLKEDGTLQQIIDYYINGSGESYTKKEVERKNGTLKVATNAEFPPYEYKANNETVGIDIDIAQAICDELGMELEVEDMAFDSIISAIQSEKCDVGIAGLTITEDRLENVDFTDTYTTAKQVIVVRKE